MKKKAIVSVLVASGLLSFFYIDFDHGRDGSASLASMPANYESFDACKKQDYLWSEIETSAYQSELPENDKMGIGTLFKMARQHVGLKGQHHSDFAPESWVKYLHRRGSIAKVKIVPVSNKYTGIFQGADCALLRLSLTYQSSDGLIKRPVAPGLAIKVLRDGIESTNISALVSLDGQEQDFNFFKFRMSNIVPIGDDAGQKIVHRIFSKAAKFPEELLLTEMASIDVHGQKIEKAISPRQLFFVPNKDFHFASTPHEVREDFAKIPAGTMIYQIYALPEKWSDFDYTSDDYDSETAFAFLNNSQHIADIVTTSPFIASKFGDDGIFFRHQLRYK